MAGSGVVCLFAALLVPILGQSVPPGTPFIEGPTYIVVGEQISLKCTSTGGNPSPSVKWFEGPTMIDDSFQQTGNRVVNDYTFTAEKRHNLIVFECQVDNEVLQNPLTSTWFFQVYTPPNQPTITGPTDIIDGTSSTHVCVSTGGNPSPVMSMRIGQTPLTAADGIVETTEFLQADFSYTVTQTITWNPTLANNGQTIFCQVDHDETRANNPQIVSLQLTVRVALSINAPQLQYNPTIGNNLVLQCVVTGTATSITWRKDNSQLFINNNARYSNGNTGTPSLTISNVQASDSGQYVCSATDGSKTVNTNVITVSAQSLPTVTIQSSTYTGQYGNSVTLVCTVSAVPFQTNVYWEKDGFAQINSGDNGYSGSTTNNPSLTITSVTTSDQGTYRCYATNVVGTGQSSTTQLTISGGLLSVTIDQPSLSAVLGSNSVTIGCTVTGQPSASSVSWTKNSGGQTTNINIGNSGKYQGGSVNNPSLTIFNIAQNDEANYVCSATNIAGTSSSQNAFLDVTGNIPTVTIPSPSYSILYGNPITIECQITANPQHTTVTWQRIVNGATSTINLNNAGKYSGGSINTPSLTISNTVSSDSGLYRCSATNAVGTGNSQDTQLSVTGSVLTVSIPQSTYTEDYSDTVTLDCVISGTPAATRVYWEATKNGVTTQIEVTNSIKYSGSSISTPSLTITNTISEDEGVYKCFAENVFGLAESNPTTLDIVGGKYIKPIPVNIPQSTYMEDYSDTVTLDCVISGTPAATHVYWEATKNNVTTQIKVTNSTKYSGSSQSTPSLTISNAIFEDEGLYKCFAENLFGIAESNHTTLDIVGSVPSAIIGSSNYQALVGNTITIGCTVTANPFAQSVYWERDIGGVVTTIGPSTNPSKYGGSTTVNPSLTINDLDFSDEGNYRCHATNIVGTGRSSQGFLDIQGQPPTVVVTLPNYAVDFGRQVSLGCTVTANPAHTSVNWKKIKNGVSTDIQMANSGKYSGSTVSSPSLVINNADLDDEASYVCYATNSIGTGQSTSTVLDVVGNIPSVVVPQQQYNVDYGQTITLTCTVTANPVHTVVYWQKIQNGQPTNINVVGSNKYSGSTVNTPSLTINNVVLSDEASYVCFATNGVGTGQSSQTTVDVAGGIPVVAILSNSYSVVVSGTVTLQCVVNANPLHTVVQWQRVVGGQTTDVSVGGNSRLSGSSVNSPSLIISQADFADEGNYICTATNAVGLGTSQQTFLDVTGTIPIVTVSQTQYNGDYGQSVTLVCTVSANPAETRVYWQRLKNGQMNEVALNSGKYAGSTVGQPSLTVSALDLNDEGFYQCFAENSVGTGSSDQTFLDVLGNIPTVNVLSNTYTVILGNTITLGCEVIATPKETTVFWRRIVNGQLQDIDMNSNSNRYSGSTVDNPSLTIRNAGNSDEGNYVCYATNLAGTGSSSQTFLDVVGSIPVVSIVQSTYSVNIGNSITLACTVSATPPETNVFWTRASGNQQEQTVQMTNTNKYSGSSVSSPSLVILNTDLSDIANYRCHASNSVGTGRSDTTTLTVVGNIPIVTVEKSSYPVNYGESVTLVCSVTAAPQHTTVFWKKVQGGQEVDIDMNTAKYSGSTVNQPSITIANTDMNDETFYICFASNSVGTGQSSQTYVDVLGNFPVVRVLSNSYSVLLGNTATLECVITASPVATIVQWYRVINGQQQTIDSSSSNYNTPTVNNPSLRVLSAANSDEGYYICSASNPVGTSSSAQTFLDVTGNIPTVTVSLPNYNTNIGATVTLGCSVIATPAANSVYWKRIGANGQTIDIDTNSNRYDGASITNPSLVIYNPDLSDEGNYVCYASNAIGTGNSQQTFLDVTGNIPNVKVQQSLYTVNIGQSATLECTVTASPQHTIVYWQKVVGGVATTISTSSSNRYSGSTVNNPSLTISASQSGDEAYYICFASNEVGTGQSSQTYLDIIGSIPIVNIGSNSYNVNYGNSITLVCTVTANPVHNSVSWTKIQNGVQTAISIDGSKYSGATVSQPSLVISNAGNSDESFYVCSATNSIGKGQSSQTYLDVVGDIPVVQILSNYYSVEIGQSVNVECEVQADPLHNSVQWKRVLNGATQNLDISNGNKYIGGTRNTPSLTIQSTGDSDEGYYICTATNAVGTGSSSQSYVDVTGSVLSVNVPQPSYSANYGQSVQLVCSVSGNPPATSVYWQKVKNGVVTTISANTNPNKYSGVTLSTPSLTVLNTDADDQAVYTCFAENAIGRSQSQQTQLQIVGSVPSVTIGQGYTVNLGSSVTIQCTVFATPSASSVTWKKISQNGAESFINVANSAKYNGGTVGTPSLTVQNAAEGDEAYYVCSATNAAGTGTSSQSFLDVLGSLPVVTIPQPQYSVIVGNDLTIGCTIDANPAHTSVTWRKIVNGQPTQLNTAGRITGSTVNNPSITITSAVASDVGYYVCYATNSVGTGSSAQTYLNVVGSIPVVTVLSTSYSVNIGNPITLQCTVSANPAATVVMWQRIINNNAVNVDMNSGHYSGSRVDSPSLVVSNAAAADEGYYICMATNSVGTGQSQQTFLDVVGSIPTVNVPVPNYTVNRGASVTLECQYSANPAATSVSWEKVVNGQTSDVILTNLNNKYGGSSVSSPSLIVNSAEESDQASYICKVTNAIGTGISTATSLDVVGNIPVVTASPLAYSVNIGDSVTVQCSVVADPLHTQVYWRKIVGGTTSNINVLNSNGKYDGSTVGAPSLIINNAAFGDQGTYVCYASNSVGTGQSTQVVVAVAGSVPSVTLSQTSFSASYGDDATLGCIISSNPTYTSVYWQKIVTGETPTTIDVSNTAKYSGSTVANPDLTIRNIGSGDIANYVCFAANSVGTGRSNQGPLNVLGSPPTVRISQTTYTVNIGNTVTIDCSVISNPTHTTVYWTRQTSGNTEETITIGGSLSTKYGGGSVVSPSLIIYNSDNSDQGTYICHATNLVGTGQSSQAFLNIVGNVPTVTATTVQSARVGSSVIITCTIVSNPAAIDVTWAKYINNQPTPIDIVNNNRLSGGTTTNPSLTINPVEQDDEGNYICQARNDVGTGSSNQVYLDIIGDPPSGITINPTKIVIEAGQTITATCLAQGSPSIIYTWTKEGSITVIKTGNILEINNAPRTALGTYTCRASNNYGSMEATTIVDVQYAPVVVISATTSAFDGQGRQSINIPCSYMSNPAATSVFWTKYNPVAGTNSGNTKLIEIDGNKYQGANLNSPSLTIYNLDRTDAGSYRCSASNIIGLGESNYVTLNIDTNAAPSFIRIRPSQVTIEEGNGYTLTCEADGDPSPLYEWYYKDIKIHEGPVLTISNAAYNNNDGLHTCKATNVVGSRQATVDVDVKYAPISAVDQASFNPALNNAVTLRCNTLANPSSTHWEWKYNGFDLDFNEKNYLVDMDSTADVGKYTCIAFNEVGQSAEIDFTVELAAGLTPAPRIVETTVSAGLTGGEIAAICLAVLFGILLIVIIIVCCVVQGCCGRKREKKERYIEREVIRTEMPYRTETIPVVKEPSVVSVREVQPRISYMESVREVPRIGYVDDSYRYMSTQQRPYYLPVVEATYDDEEYRKQKKKKKSKKNRMYGQDLAADNEIYLEERVVGSVRGSRKGDEIITGPEMYFEAE